MASIREIFGALDTSGKGVISTKQLAELASKIDPQGRLQIREKDIIEFGDPTFYGHITFNYYVQALSQCVVNFEGSKMSLLKYVNEVSD